MYSDHITNIHASRAQVCILVGRPNTSISLTLISDTEARRGAAVVCGEQQEQEVGCGNQEMRCLGAVVFADQWRRG